MPRAAALCVLCACCVAARVTADDARWHRLDSLLPPSLRDALPSLLRFAGDLCELPRASEDTDDEEMYVVEHSASGSVRYPAGAWGARVAAARPAGVAVYAGGWGNRAGDAAARALVPALLRRHDVVLELDVAAPGGYAAAAARVPRVGRALAGLVLAAAAARVPPARLHLVGFSLGAHACGAAARAVRAAGAGRVARLTALDPARACFARGAAARRRRVRRDDAAFVQVVHSSALGLARRLGHVDVYVRGAGAGVGAAALARAHAAAWRLWAAEGLRGARCGSAGGIALRAGNCSGEEVAVGYACAPDTRGVFLVQTDDDLYSF